MYPSVRLFAFAALVTLPLSLRAQRPLLLVPQPREGRVDREVALPRGVQVVTPTDSGDAFAARDLRDALRESGVPIARGSGSARVVLLRSTSPAAKALIARTHATFAQEMRDEGYLLVPDGTTLTVTATDGTAVKVATSSTTTVTRSAASDVASLALGEQVTVIGATANGTVTAQTISEGTGGMGFGGGAGGPGGQPAPGATAGG